MSIEAIRWALKDAPGVPAPCLGVLIGLAEHADRHGRGSFPSARTLCAYSRKSERQVRYDLMVLVDAKLIRPGEQSLAAHLPVNRRPVVYDLAMERLGVQPVAGQEPEPAGVQPTAEVQPIAPRQSIAPQTDPDLHEQAGVQPVAGQDELSLGCNTASPGVQPIADKPKELNLKSKPSSRRRRDLSDGRDDAMRLCVHLADKIEANGSKRPVITKGWLDAARLLMDVDGRTEEQAHRAIDWCQGNEFWRKNVMSMPKLREKYDRLRMEAEDERKAAANGRRAAPPAGTKVSPRNEHRLRR